MTTAKPSARYGAMWGRACGRLCSTELHHRWGHDPFGAYSALWYLFHMCAKCAEIEPRIEHLETGKFRNWQVTWRTSSRLTALTPGCRSQTQTIALRPKQQ